MECGYRELLACFDCTEVLVDLMPDFKMIKYLYKQNAVQGLLYVEQNFPWPLAVREMVFNVSGVQDYKNRGCFTISKSMPVGATYFGVKIPEVNPKNSRMEVRQGVNFFQHLGPMKSRHMQIFNVDPKIDFLPAWLLNSVLYNTMKSNIQGLQKFGPKMHDP